MIINALLWAVFGLVAGAVAKLIMPGKDPGGFIITMGLGILGSVIGGFLSSVLFGWDIQGFNLASFAVAVGGALLLLLLYRLVVSAKSS